MAGLTPDSLNAPTGMPPVAGPGSQTPKNSPMAAPPPIGGGPSMEPNGDPGPPEKDNKSEDPKSDKESFNTLVDDISDALNSPSHVYDKEEKEENKKKVSINEILEFLYSKGWSSKRLDYLADLLDGKEKELISSIKKHIKKDDVSKTKKMISDKLKLNEPPPAAAPPVGGPPMGGPPPPMDMGPPPPMGAMASSNDREITDVDLEKINLKRGHFMSKKFIIGNGTVSEVEVSADTQMDSTAILNKLSMSMRKVKVSIKEVEDAKLRYAGVLAMKYAEEGFPPMGGEDLGGEDMGGDMPPMDEEIGGEDEKVEQAIDGVEKAQEELTKVVEVLQGDVDNAEGASDILAEEEPMGAEKIDKTIEKAGALISEARKVIASAKTKEAGFPFWLKGKGKGKDKDKDKDDKKKDKKDDKDDKKKDDKDDKKKDDKKDKKGMTLDVEDFAKLVQAKMEELRGDKEANLYPFKEQIKPIPSVDNTNAETASKTISTVDSEIKKQPAKDKNNENLNHGDLGQVDLPVKTDKGGAKSMETKQTKVSIEVAERLRKHSVENTIDKSRLAVQLSAQQQLKGLIADPLKEALVKGMTEFGVTAEIADAIVHNAYVDAYEASHTAMIDEAFGSLMEKDFDEFVKVAEFVKDYTVKTASADSTTEETFKDKTASADSFGLNGFKDDKSSKAEFKGYWENYSKELGYGLK